MNLHLLLFTQFGHEGESDLIWACSLGMPFYLLADLGIKVLRSVALSDAVTDRRRTMA